MKFAGKRVVITGGSSGIGLHLALAFAAADAEVVVVGRSQERLKKAAEFHKNIEGIACDVTNDDDVKALAMQMQSRGGTDILVNNAGVMHFFDVAKGYPLAKQQQEIEIDVVGPVRMVTHFLPQMMTHESCILNVSSGLAYVPFAAAPVYSGAKAFIHAWTRSLRRQLRGQSVRVVELLPPVVDTPLAEGLDPSFKRMPPAELAKALLKGLSRGDLEITPGQSLALKLLGRLAPSLAFWMLNRNSN